MLHRLNPFRGIESPRAVAAWGLYDLANQSFQLLINTLLFSIYLTIVVVGDGKRAELIWGAMFFISNALVVLSAPVLGALADARAWKKEILLATGCLCVVMMACFPLLGPGAIALAVALYVPAAFACGTGENFLAAFLPELAKREQMGRISALGWSMSYVGALVLLLICFSAVTWFGLAEPEQWKGLFVLSAVWFAVFMVPTVLWLNEKAVPRPGRDDATAIVDAFRRLKRTIREAGKFAQLATFLAIFFVYSMGTQTVVFFAGIIGNSFGFGIDRLILMAVVMAVTAGVGAITTGMVQDRLGHRNTVMSILGVWVLATTGLAVLKLRFAASGADTSTGPGMAFWVIAGAIGLGLGGIGTASRALVGAFTPERRSAEFFGLWGMVYKLASIGGILFGVASEASRFSLFLIAGFFAVGLALMPLVNEKAGMAAASADDQSPME
ncbi:MAG: MFS transporter [Phycisphaeraceae bacterium]|nr:MFS transporter [Phycisphaeraceae bacterium]